MSIENIDMQMKINIMFTKYLSKFEAIFFLYLINTSYFLLLSIFSFCLLWNLYAWEVLS